MLRNRKGFTLVEVVVVLVILGILAAVMIPALTGWIDNARKTECRSKMGMVARDYHTWVADYGYGLVTPVAGNEATLLNSAVTDILNRAATGDNTYVCPYGGNCAVTFSRDSLAITQITCSLHGTVAFGASGGAAAAMTDQEIGDTLATELTGKKLPNGNIYGVDGKALAAIATKQAAVDMLFTQELISTLTKSEKSWTLKPNPVGSGDFLLCIYTADALNESKNNGRKDVHESVLVYDSQAKAFVDYSDPITYSHISSIDKDVLVFGY